MNSYLIERLGHLGDGIARGPVFAPGTLPGEEVNGVLIGDRLESPSILKPSPDRVSAPCPHFKSCGGCQLQHASNAFLRSWKSDIVRSALASVGIETEFLPVHVSPPHQRRRAKLAARRTKKGAIAGFYAKGSGEIVNVSECRVVTHGILKALPMVRSLAAIGASRKQALSVTLTESEAGLDVAVEAGKPLSGQMRMKLAGLAKTFDLARLSWEHESVVLRRQPIQKFNSIEVVPPPGAFLQATRDGESMLRKDVERILGEARKVVDLFAGCGTFALPLARNADIHAVEGDAEMLSALELAWRHGQILRAISTETRDLYRQPLTSDEFLHFHAAVIDPPRSGAEAQVKELSKSGLMKIAYVSCNPVTFARDARTLVSGGYSLKNVRVVDQFRWSTHVELVAEFTFNSC